MNQPTVYEEQIIRDQGEDFKKRVRTTIKRFDQYINPLKLGIRNVSYQIYKTITDLVQNLVHVEEEIQKQIINSCYYRYFTKFEDYHFRFMLQCLNYIFQNDQPLTYNADLNYKYVTLIYVEQLRFYFHQVKDKTLDRLLQRLNIIKREKEKDELEEGFWEEDETEVQSHLTRIKGTRQQNTKENENEFCHTKKEMHLKDLQIKGLQTKLFHREQSLVSITAGYLKDLQLLREQLYRKDQQIMNYDECYEVSYMDFSDVLDPQIKSLLKLQIDDLKLQFEKRTLDLIKMVAIYKNEISAFKNQIQKLNNQKNQIEAPSELIMKLLNVDDNPYRIWKYIADLRGNFFFKDVFEFQKPVYGLNYKEINQLLMTNKGYEREYQQYKENLYQEFQLFCQKCQNDLHAYKTESEKAKISIIEIEEKAKNMKLEILSSAMKLFNEKYEDEKQILQSQLQEKLQQLESETKKNDKIKLKYILKLWSTIIKANRHSELKELLKSQSLIDERIEEYQLEIKNLKQQISHYFKVNNEMMVQTSELSQQLNIVSSNSINWNNQIKEQQYQIQKLQQSLRESENQKALIESCNSKIIKIIDNKLQSVNKYILQQVKSTDINLDDKNSNLTKSIIDNIKKLNTQQVKQIKELKFQASLNLESYVIIYMLFQKAIHFRQLNDVTVQTDPWQPQDVHFSTQSNIDEKHPTSQIDSSQQIENKQQKKNSIKRTSIQQQQPLIQSEKFDKQEKPQQSQRNSFSQKSNNQKNPKSESSQINRQRRSISTQPQTILPQQQNTDIKTSEFQIKEDNDQSSYRQQSQIQNDSAVILNQIDEEKETLLPIKSSLKQSSKTERVRTNSVQDRNQKLPNSLGRSVNFELVKEQNELNKEISFAQLQEPFNRLYQESFQKTERIKALKENLELLEKSHWDDIISLFSQKFSSNITIFDKQSPPKIEEIPKYQGSLPFRTLCNRQYYQKVKSQTPNQIRSRSWINRQTQYINQMLGQLEEANQTFERSVRTAGPNINNSLLPERIQEVMRETKRGFI